MQTRRLLMSVGVVSSARAFQALLLLASFLPAVAQTQLEVTKADAQRHLLRKAEPVYPSFAKAAGIDGVVHVRVGIGLDGRVGALLGSSGPPSLIKPAEDAVLSYSYEPFEANGHVTYVQATVDVLFNLRTHKRIPPPPRLSRESFWGSDYHHPLTDLPPALREWLTSHRPPDREQVCDSSQQSCGSERMTPTNERVLEQIDVFQISSDKSNHLYLVTWHGDCGATGNCVDEVLEKNSKQVRSILTTIGSGFYVHPRSDSLYPDIFFASHISAREVGIQGYVNAAGEWGELYCGELEINDDQSEWNNVRICN